jgi:mannose-6-phosphate isomerase-like protein (cupin superfamily)
MSLSPQRLAIALAFASLTMSIPVSGARRLEAQADEVAVHDFSTLTSNPLGTLKVKAVIANSGSVGIADLPGGSSQRPQHHEQEQVVLGLAGAMDFSNGGASHRIERYRAVLAPSNAEHYFVNNSSGTGTFLEYQPMQRPDWLPPHPRLTVPQSPAPLPIAPGLRVADDFSPSSTGWRAETTGARSKTLNGRTIRMTVWDIPSNASVEVVGRDTGREHLAYLLDGRVEATLRAGRREFGPQILFVIPPSGGSIRLKSIGSPHSVIAVFESGAF